MPNRKITKKQIALLHVAKQQLGMDDELYRQMLASVGVDSSLQLTGRQYNEVMRRLEAGGFRAVNRAPRTQSHVVTEERLRMVRKVVKLSEAMNLDLAYALGIARRMWGVEKLEWCTPLQLRGVVAALIKKQQADAKKGAVA